MAMADDTSSTGSRSPTLPDLQPPSETALEVLKPYFAGEPKSLSGIALRAFCLGSVFSASLLCCLAGAFFAPDELGSRLWRAPFFMAALSAFHFLEFWTTAHRNTLVASIDSFLLTANWPAYAVAHASALLECVLVDWLFPGHRARWGLDSPWVVGVGLVLVAVGQAVRSVAMLEAGASFNHQVQTRRARSHLLVTSGVYAHLRHPSYFGFFYWGVGTQLVLGNAVCFTAYAAVLWLFFNDRIRTEEARLIEFFGRDYVDYRAKVGTKIPFVP